MITVFDPEGARLREDHKCSMECGREFLSEWDEAKHRTGSFRAGTRRCKTDEELLDAGWDTIPELETPTWAHPQTHATFLWLSEGQQRRAIANRYHRDVYAPGRHYDALNAAAKNVWWADVVMQKVVKREDGCWTWSGNPNTRGSGSVALPRAVIAPISGKGSVTVRVAQAVWAISKGSPPDGVMSRTCKTSGCVNPDHHEIAMVD